MEKEYKFVPTNIFVTEEEMEHLERLYDIYMFHPGIQIMLDDLAINKYGLPELSNNEHYFFNWHTGELGYYIIQ